MNRSRRISLLGIMILLFMSSTAFATHIDFTEFDVPNANHNVGPNYSTTVNDLTITFTAAGDENLYWDDTDGFGVWGSGYEWDEIEEPEALIIEFDTPVYVTYFDITDLFLEGGSYQGGYYEIGWYNSDGNPDSYTQFQQTDPTMILGETNGVYILTIDAYVDTIWFSAPGQIDGQNHEFSVAGVEVNPVPEPATILLLGSGLIGLVGLRRRFSKT